jgi:uncharacterized protein YdeI (YjbR/CyaY-like superfamily)
MSLTREAQLERYEAGNRKDWREWLARNHATAPGVWLVSYKKSSGKQGLRYDEAVEEALCFGWIDSKAKTLDEERSMLLFTPRKSKSPWSRPNKERVERLIREGLMTKAGQEAIEAARRSGRWNAYDAVEALVVPEDLKEALAGDGQAQANFEGFSASAKKSILRWIESAKRPETRMKRIQETVRLAAQNIKANQ